MKNFILFLCVIFITSTTIAQPSPDLDNSLDTIWEQSQNPQVLEQIGLENSDQQRIPLIPLAPSRTTIPGDATIQIPIEQTKGPLNASPNDTRAYILYNRATIAFQNNQQEKARSLYRELIRRYPDSSYTPFSLYVLSLSEPDYRRKIRILLTIKERFPEFPYNNLIIDTLGELFYLLGDLASSDMILKESVSYKSLYFQAMISLDKQRPNNAISLIRKALQKAPDNESAYKIYILYVEALIHLKSFKNVLTVLEKAASLRPWAFDNGIAVLLNAGKSFFHNGQYSQALYTFSMLRLRFSRSSEVRLADQYIEALNRKGIVEIVPVPWIAKNFDTLIQERPTSALIPPAAPTLADIQAMNNLPTTGVTEPSIDNITAVPPMPIPVPVKRQYDVLVPVQNLAPNVELITITNTVQQTITNTIENFLTNRIFVVETNTFTNSFAGGNGGAFRTNVIRIYETNNIVSYEPVVLWKTNYRQIDLTNLVTNIIDVVITNEKIELFPLKKTNYNFVNRDKNITNVIIREITNRYLEYGLDNKTNWKEDIVQKRFIEIIPAWKTTYQTIDTNELVTNVIVDIVTNQRLELVPRWVSNLRTNNTYQLRDRIITNRRLRIAPRWITNYQVIQTNMKDVVITNIQNVIQTNFTEKVFTNTINHNIEQTNIITNAAQVILTNFINKEVPIPAPIQFAPSEFNSNINALIDEEEQKELLIEPIYTTPIEEEQIKFVSQEVTKLERLASQIAEKSAGIAGEYGFSDNKGYVIRIAELKDLSVANIVLRDISKLNLGTPAGIYYRDSIYYLEMRSIKDKMHAEKIYQTLYKLGYTGVQLFEQYEVTEYQE